MEHKHYLKFCLMAVLHFIAMYLLMYAMVNNLFFNFYHSLNQFYMAGLMTASMVGIEMAVMRSMYPNKALNYLLIVLGILALVGFWFFTRQQVGVSDQQFVRSMIPHHAGAILMCERADLNDMELKDLCKSIIENQRSEIDQMKNVYERLK